MKIKKSMAIILPLAVFLLLTGMTILAWEREVAHKREIFQNYTVSSANEIAHGLEHWIDNYAAVLKTFGDRWLERTDRSQERFKRFAHIYMERFSDFERIYLLDRMGVVRWTAPLEGNEEARYFVEAEEFQKTGSAGLVKLTEEAIGLSICVPLIEREKPAGYINGVISFDSLISRRMARYAEDEFHLHLLFGKNEVFCTSDKTARAHKLHSVNMPLRVVNQKYQLELVPGLGLEAQMKTIFSLTTLFLGLMMSAALGLLILFLIRRIELHIQAKDEISHLYLYNKALTEANLDPMVTFDKKGLILNANRAMIQAVGKRHEDLIGTLFKDCFIDPKHAHEMVQEVFEAGKLKDYELSIKGEGITETILLCNTSVFKDQNEEICGALACSRDVTKQKLAKTEQKKASEKIAFLNKNLGKTVDQLERKNDELERVLMELKATQAQILQSEKMASIGQLAAGVAHEINNPTGFVSSNLNVLAGYDTDIKSLIEQYRAIVSDIKAGAATSANEGRSSISEQLSHIAELEKEVDIDFILNDTPNLIKECREGAERIKKIVIDLKDFAHPVEHKLNYADINKNMESTLNVVWNELKYKARVVKEYGELPQVKCYSQQINQVFVNLLVNAAQAIAKEGEIRISTRKIDDSVEIKISDTGAGIPKENLLKIFDPFFTTKEVGKGTGLGLNVAYNIIKKHKGTIEVQSEIGKGTTFTIQIPID